MANCVACGAFFALCFLHMVPQSEEKWRGVFTTAAAAEGVQKNNSSNTTLLSQNEGQQPWEDEKSEDQYIFPVGSLLILLSFTTMLFIEQKCTKNQLTDTTSTEKVPIIILTKVQFHYIPI